MAFVPVFNVDRMAATVPGITASHNSSKDKGRLVSVVSFLNRKDKFPQSFQCTSHQLSLVRGGDMPILKAVNRKGGQYDHLDQSGFTPCGEKGPDF